MKLSEPGCACNTESEVSELGFGGIELDSPRLTPFFELEGGSRKMKPPVLARVTQEGIETLQWQGPRGLYRKTVFYMVLPLMVNFLHLGKRAFRSLRLRPYTKGMQVFCIVCTIFVASLETLLPYSSSEIYRMREECRMDKSLHKTELSGHRQ